MKGLQALLICCAAVAAFGQSTSTNSQGTNTRFFGGLGQTLGAIAGQTVGTVLNPIANAGFNGGFGQAPSSGCVYWCRTPEGQAYCCQNNNQPQGPVGTKPGNCPPVRPTCPNIRNFSPPQPCSNDFACRGYDKCCFDRCLGEHICKSTTQQVPGGFGFPFGR